MKNSVLDRLKSYFDEYFSDATKPTARNLFLIIVSILALDIFRSVRFAHRHVLAKLSDTSLNAYYYALKTDRLDHESWRNVTLSKALKAVPVHLAAQPLFLSIDDTMVEKEGDKFELRSRLFDHAAHNGSNYLDGHCMVSILLSFPVMNDGSIFYLSVPLGYRLWDKKQTKLEIAAGTHRETRPSKEIYGNVCRRKISGLNHQKPGAGRWACALYLPDCGEDGWSMPLSHSQKAGMAAAGCSSAPRPRKRSHLTTGIVQMMRSVNTGRKTSAISCWPATCSAGTLRYHIM